MPRLIDADALLETIEDHCTALSCCLTVEQWRGKTDMKRQVIEDIHNAPTIRFAEDINVPNNGWISVKDKPPKSRKRYLTIGPKGVMRVAKAYVPSQELPDWRGDPDYHWWECESKRCAVAYYMPLPPEPEKETGHE